MKPFVIIISGLSGAGKTVTLRSLEDSSFFCVDNLHPSLIDDFIRISVVNSKVEKIGIGIDIREKEFLNEIEDVIHSLRKRYNLHIIFLEAEPDCLVRRYKETRRPHPLAQSARGNILGAIEMEKKLLNPLRSESDRIIDTSPFNPHQLRHLITSTFGRIQADTLKVTLISFGFKYGMPQHLDMLLDVRFLPNPHYVDDLRPLTGLDEPVKQFVFKNKLTLDFLDKIKDLMNFLIPQYVKEGKTYLAIGVGCTGGKHRSPAIIERLKDYLQKHDLPIEIIHRDI